MNKNKRIVVFLAALLGLGGCEYTKDLPVLGRIIAKNICDGVYISGYDPTLVSTYVSGFAPPLKNSWSVTLDEANSSVVVRNRWFTFLPAQTADLASTTDARFGCRNRLANVEPTTPAALSAPSGHHSFAEDLQQYPGLQAYVESVAAAGAPTNTTALIVIHDQTVVAEVYRDGVTRTSPLKGFSMSKSFGNLLVGRLVDKGVLSVGEPMPIDAWSSDARGLITWDHSLHMSSGLDWHEAAIGKDNHQTQMLYGSADPSLYALDKPVAFAPGTQFNYSSGDFMNVATALVDRYPHWFDPGWDLDGQYSLEFTPDGRYPLLPEGVSLTLRGWAQLIAIYANEGRLGDLQILSPEWVRYSLAPQATNGDYGAGIWLNQGQALFPRLPADAIAFIGAYDRYAVAIPSRKLIFVRIGYSEQPDDFDMQGYVEGVMGVLSGE